MKRIISIDVALAIIMAAALLLLLIYRINRGEEDMDRDYGIPPVDTSKPAVTETATFAMG